MHNPVVIDKVNKFTNLSSLNIIFVASFIKKIKNINALLKVFSIVQEKNPFVVLHVVGIYNKGEVNGLVQNII